MPLEWRFIIKQRARIVSEFSVLTMQERDSLWDLFTKLFAQSEEYSLELFSCQPRFLRAWPAPERPAA